MTVKEINDYVRDIEEDTPLLSSCDLDFWDHYIDNHDELDQLFVKRYKSMHYFSENDFVDDDEEVEDWLYTIESFLIANAKKYHELYRIQGLEDEDLSMINNYDMIRTSTSSTSDMGSTSDGQRTDINNSQIGNQNFVNSNKVSAFNTSTQSTKDSSSSSTGSRNDITQFTKGREDITHNNQITNTSSSHDVGNLGVQTGADILMRYHDSINKGCFDFYEIVFKDICNNFLIWGD